MAGKGKVQAPKMEAAKVEAKRKLATKRDYKIEDLASEGVKGQIAMVIKLASKHGKASGFAGVDAGIKQKKDSKADNATAIANKINAKTHFYKENKEKRGAFWHLKSEALETLKEDAKAAAPSLVKGEFNSKAAKLINDLFAATKSERVAGVAKEKAVKLTDLVSKFNW